MKSLAPLLALFGLFVTSHQVSAEGIFHLMDSPCHDDGCGSSNSCCATDGCAATGCESCLEVSCLNGLCLDGLLKSGDPCFNDFISPMTNPIYFQDPRIQSEARFIFLNHDFPTALGGGKAQVYALQLRAAITENLSVIATKDGYAVSDSPLLDDGWADVAAGLQYNLYKDHCTKTLLSAGAVFEFPVGNRRALQGNGDGEFHLFLTGGTEIADDWHLVSGTGFILPSNRAQQSQVWYLSNHIDRQLGDTGLYLLGEVNWYHWLSGADEFLAPVEGLDYANLGSVSVGGNDIVTGAVGVKYKPADNQEIGLAIEYPLSSRNDILDQRLTIDWIVRY